MNILLQALNKINPINKKQKDFLMALIPGLIGTVGKKTFRNLSRYMELHEQTISRHMSKFFDFIGLNTELIKTVKDDDSVLIAAQDATFISKSGKRTSGIDYFWNGCASKAEKGLEFDSIAIIKINDKKREGYNLSAEQTPSNPIPKKERKKTTDKNKKKTEEAGPTRIDFYVKHVQKIFPKLFELCIKYMAVDGFFAKEKYVNGVVALGLHVISKLRKDARFRYVYTGPQKARGRKKKFDVRKVNLEDFPDLVEIKINEEAIELRSNIVYSVSLKRLIKVVLVRKLIGIDKYGEALLFSTDLQQDSLQIYQFYTARFQIEFIFRDAKGFTGLGDCQSLDPKRLHYHFNASLTALNVAKLEDNELQKKEETQRPFSMTNLSRKYHVDIVINRFILTFGLDQTFIKSHPDYDKVRTFANVKH